MGTRETRTSEVPLVIHDEESAGATGGKPPPLPPSAFKTSTVYQRRQSKNLQIINQEGDVEEVQSCMQKFYKFLYNKETNAYCGRTVQSWGFIIAYSTLVLMFLISFTMLLLYATLTYIRHTVNFKQTSDSSFPLNPRTIEMTITPTPDTSDRMIWFRRDRAKDYAKYINNVEHLIINKRRKRDVNRLGPCGEYPYGYGDRPCVIVRINKRYSWFGDALDINSTETPYAPKQVQEWIQKDRKLWLHCGCVKSNDEEYIKLRYFPDPPGFDPNAFPLVEYDESPLVALQILEYTLGTPLIIECKLWYQEGPSLTYFRLHVDDGNKTTV